MPTDVDRELAVIAEQCTARGRRGVVAAAAPLAAQCGIDALAHGGNAYDAAVAAALAETVLLPPKCGLGGDLIALRIEPGRAPDALLAVGGAPAGLAEVARTGRWSDVGPLSVGPPGAPAGYAALAALGRLGLARLAAPAIELASGGFPWAAVATRLATQAAALVRELQPDGCVYYPNGEPIAPGSIVRLPGLAAVLESFAELGGGLMSGPVGRAAVDAVRSRGGVLTLEDLDAACAEWLPCATGSMAGRTVWTTPAPTHGPSLLEAVSGAGRDGAGADDPVATLRRVFAAIARQREVLGDPGGTSMVSAADEQGTVVVIVHSNSYPRFGSGIVVEDYDLVLANRAGRGFTPVPGHPNFPIAGRRPVTTLHAWTVAGDDGAPRLAGATPGGVNQLPWNAQALRRIAGGEDAPGRLVTAPLWEWIPADGDTPDALRIERGTPGAAGLREEVARTVDAPLWGCKSAQQVIRIPRGAEAWVAAADPRTVGLALGR